MLFKNLAIVLAAVITGVSALPADANLKVVTIADANVIFKGVKAPACNGFLPPHSSCTPGQCQCIGNNGCWGCGGRVQCQPGPGSGICWTE